MERRGENNQGLINILRSIGYALLLLVAFDAIATLIPFRFFSPSWEFNTIGRFVERVPLVLLAFGIIFYASREPKNQKDRIIWISLRWLTLIIGICFLLMAPLLVVNSIRLKTQTDTQVATEVTQQLSSLDKLEKQIKAGNPIDIKNSVLKTNPNPQLDLENKTPDEVKNQLLKEISVSKQNTRQNVEKKWQSNRTDQVKNTVKWFMGAIVAAVSLIWIWRFT
jgi:hypothetical protein